MSTLKETPQEAKEKAIELYNTYFNAITLSVGKEAVKLCALSLVDQILLEISSFMGKEVWSDRFVFWKQVKNEIIKL